MMDHQKEKIYLDYTKLVLDTKKRPFSLREFFDKSGIEESVFRRSFKNLATIESGLWLDLFIRTKSQIESEEVYIDYSIREKLLAFYFTWFEFLKEYRQFFIWLFEKKHVWELWPSSMNLFQKHFVKYANTLVQEGKMTQEVADRPIITDYYGKSLWLQIQFLLKFWLRDNSKEFEDTDAAIEKAVNFTMDLINNNYVDSFFGLSKFVLKKW